MVSFFTHKYCREREQDGHNWEERQLFGSDNMSHKQYVAQTIINVFSTPTSVRSFDGLYELASLVVDCW